MTAPDVAARVTAWLDRLEGLHTAASKGPWGIVGGTHDRAVIDDHGCHVATTGIIPDAAAIVAEHNAMGSLLALARGVTALADELESFTVDRNPAPGSYDAGVVAAFVNVAARLRRLLADAAPDTGEETA